MPGPAGQLKKLYQQIIGGTAPTGAGSKTGDISQMVKELVAELINGTAPSGAASPTGDISQMVKELVGKLAGTTDLGAMTGSATGSLGEQLAYLAAKGGALKVTGSGYLVMPAAASGIDPANAGVAWNNGAWSEVVASTSEADSIIGISFGYSSIGAAYEVEIDIGTGAGGAEAVKSTIPGSASQVVGAPATQYSTGEIFLFPCPIEVATTTRIAVRVRSNDTGRQPNNIKLIYAKAAELIAR